MKLRLGSKTAQKNPGIIASIGKFDGLHLGHQYILKETVARARQLGLESAVISFHPHPAKVLTGRSPDRIFSLRQQILGLAELGIDQIIFVKFDKQLAALEAEDFIQQYFYDRWSVKELFIGPFASIGKNRKGNTTWLKDYFKDKELKLHVVDPQLHESERLSSNRLRQAVQSGNFELVKSMTGREYSILERVQHGAKLGRQLGFRTANLQLKNRAKPPYGVYAGYAVLNGQKYQCVANFGCRPSTEGQKSEVFEAHLIGYDGEEFYRQFLEVQLLVKIRDEQKFPSLEALKTQISKDLQTAKDLLE